MVALIDADSLFYLSSKDSIQESIVNIEERIESMLNNTKADEFILCLSSKPYFRDAIYPEYKSNRKPGDLKYLKTLKSYLRETYKCLEIKGLEADDLVIYLSSKFKECIICAIDKDVIKQSTVNTYNFTKDEFVKPTPQEASMFLLKQLIMGDSVDSIPGIPRIGEKTADSLLHGLSFNEGIKLALEKYIDAFGLNRGITMFYTNFKLVYMLRNEADVLTHAPELVNDINLEDFTNKYIKTNTEWDIL
jgi:DNA polymerase-1